ncbi:hypothetical protein WPS_21050 [Vulcanimicrobium alpinum]|uniref:WYL domain-containing protein n=1 Tax=Vulcanimicrobium alpinum TaxID=3016050 RepID=A0AAN1XWV7_UNVUL|nr:WYL domain-containing protein [Vulcanimicrobium alpinum]BDE06829.1 hypothetical protein WPS_21050 [Vulcanimicrobium alpinum]
MSKRFEDLDDAGRRDTGEAPESVARKIWLLLELLRHKRVRLDDYQRLHEVDKRSFQRDLQQLRAIGKSSGFRIAAKIKDGAIGLESLDTSLRRLDEDRPPFLALIAEIARTLGEPFHDELGAMADRAPEGETFLHLQAPRLVEGSRVAQVYEKLKSAWASRDGRAQVRFRYRSARAAEATDREVEPYRVVVRSGRYYLVGYDLGKKKWRFFALDAIVGLPTRSGTAARRRTIPEGYANPDVLGFMQGDETPVAVTVEFTPVVAAAAASRVWHRGQEVTHLPDGRVRIAVRVVDVDEVVRWTFGFGAQAKVVAPEAAVAAARRTADAIAAVYASAG